MKRIIPILFAILLMGCSSDDDSGSTDDEGGVLGDS